MSGITLPKCHAAGCTDYCDPRYAIHGPDGTAVPACDGHGNPGCDGCPCSCPPHNGEMSEIVWEPTVWSTRVPGGRASIERKDHGFAWHVNAQGLAGWFTVEGFDETFEGACKRAKNALRVTNTEPL